MDTTCSICGTDEYYESDGFYFCCVCNTQSQEMVVTGEATLDQTMLGGLLREVVTDKKSREKRSAYVPGRPWTRYEAFQLILQGQAKALIAHGAQPSIKDTILRLYFAYLAKLEVAFVGEERTRLIPKGLENSKYNGWHREFDRGGMENSDVNPKAMKHKLRKGKRQREKELMKSALAGETFYKGDNPFEDGEDEDDDFETSSRSSFSGDSGLSTHTSDGEDDEEDERKARKTKKNTPKKKANMLGGSGVLDCVQFMNVQKTLAFCYLGCLFSSPLITVSDLIRWINDGSLPFLETSHMLNPDMKLSGYDHGMFTVTANSVTQTRICFEAGRLLCLLGFEEIPRFRIKDITIKYTLLLDLPECLVPCVAKLIREFPVDCRYRLKKMTTDVKTLAQIDALSTAYILVALKLTFGLDDSRERLLSKYTKQVQEKIGNGVQLFDWCTWQTHATYKFLSSACLRDMPESNKGKFEVTSVDSLCETFEKANYKVQNFSHQKLFSYRKKSKVARFQQDNRELLKKSANFLEDCWKNRDATAARVRAEGAAETASYFAADPVEEAPCFRSSSLDHIVKAEEFLRSHLGHRVSPTSSVCNESSAIDSDSSSVSCSQSSTASLFSHPTFFSGFGNLPTFKKQKRGQKRKRELGQGQADSTPDKRRVKKRRLADVCAQTGHAVADCGPVHQEMEQQKSLEECEQDVSQLMAMRLDISEDYLTYPRRLVGDMRNPEKLKELRAQQHQSYKWLLKVLSRLTFCLETDIELMVWDVEYLMMKRFCGQT